MKPQNSLPKLLPLIPAIIIVIVLVSMGLATFSPVGTGEVGVVTRFGQVTGRELGEGFNFKAPWEKVTIYTVRVQKDQAQAEAATNDLQQVSSTLALNFHLDRGRISDIHRNIGPEYLDRIVSPAVQEVFKSASAKFTAAQLITNRADVKNDVVTNLKTRLEPRGIMVDDLSIVDFQFSPDFAKAIEQKQVAQQNAERAEFTLAQAQKDAEAQAAQKESLTPDILQKMAIEKWDGHLPTYLGQNSVFGIPNR
jgi:regulator of protease activity HflC (stomatin/prohibitin superfamily)